MDMENKRLLEYDWDALLIMDACRFDYFKEVVDNGDFGFFDTYTSRWSTGSCTIEWFKKEFPDRYPEIKYVSANPYIREQHLSKDHEIVASNHFPDLVSLIETDAWSDEVKTIPPWTVNEVVKDVLKDCSKRKVIHYMQPHTPFIGEPSIPLDDILKERKDMGVQKNGNVQTVALKQFLSGGKYVLSDIVEAYKGNIELILNYLEEICGWFFEETDVDKVVITSDHGEGLFDDGFFNHPCYKDKRYLREVPFIEVEE